VTTDIPKTPPTASKLDLAKAQLTMELHSRRMVQLFPDRKTVDPTVVLTEWRNHIARAIAAERGACLAAVETAVRNVKEGGIQPIRALQLLLEALSEAQDVASDDAKMAAAIVRGAFQ
jgi:hypothetical protein